MAWVAVCALGCSATEGGGAPDGGTSGRGGASGAAGSTSSGGAAGSTSSGGAGGSAAGGGAGGSTASGGAGGSAASGGAGSPLACLDELAALGVPYSLTEARGVVDAVHVEGPIGGVLFANGTDTDPMSDPVACEFVKTLHAFAGLLQAHGFARVGTLGSYCYRCCCAWSETNFCRGVDDPEPDCSQDGYSTHSWGRAIDVRYLWTTAGARYDIDDPTDFVISTAGGSVCVEGLASQSGISRELYQLACDASAEHVFGTILTPNYNAAHRNHFHMDIGREGTPGSYIVRSGWTAVDPPGHADTCGR